MHVANKSWPGNNVHRIGLKFTILWRYSKGGFPALDGPLPSPKASIARQLAGNIQDLVWTPELKSNLYRGGACQEALVIKNLPVNTGDASSVPGWGRYPGGGHGNPLQYSYLENPMDRGAWQAKFYRVTKIRHNGSNLAHAYTRAHTHTHTLKWPWSSGECYQSHLTFWASVSTFQFCFTVFWHLNKSVYAWKF